jgi:hypothetical protein
MCQGGAGGGCFGLGLAALVAAVVVQPRRLDDRLVDLVDPLLLGQRVGLGLEEWGARADG